LDKVKEFVQYNKLYLFEFDYFHQTAFHWAAKRGYFDMLRYLISKGNHINQYDNNKRTPLWLASRNNHLACCQLLLENKANPYLDNKDQRKPIDVAGDLAVKKLIGDYMETYNYMNGKTFFKSQVLKQHKEDFVNILSGKTKESQKKKREENLKGLSKASMMNRMSTNNISSYNY
jgi:ankyrin repeat protein